MFDFPTVQSYHRHSSPTFPKIAHIESIEHLPIDLGPSINDRPLSFQTYKSDDMSVISPSERSYIITGLSDPAHPTRLDGRSLLSPLPIQISYGDAPQASGSARVVLGEGTEVIAGIRLEVVDVDPSYKGKGKEGWRATVEVDV